MGPDSDTAMASGDSSDDAPQPSVERRDGGAREQQDEPAAQPKRRSGTKGKPGKALTLAKLQSVFGLSLQARLCASTNCWNAVSVAEQQSQRRGSCMSS